MEDVNRTLMETSRTNEISNLMLKNMYPLGLHSTLKSSMMLMY